jgi:geranylgeranyl reductase family protein
MTRFRAELDDAEVAIVGGGPAGSIAAFTLASAGHDVVVVDKAAFPREKACGDGLTSSAVSFLHELGLDQALEGAQSIEAARLCVDWDEYEVSPMRSRRGDAWIHACCIPRARLDDALMRHACAAGARLVRGYVTGPLRHDGRVIGVELSQDGVERVITARHVLAADGATSRLRRQLLGPLSKDLASSFAVRRYLRTGRALEPVFEIYVPVTDPYVGYGWVFPVSDRVANVGIAYATARGLPRPPGLTDLLDSFVGSLQTRRGSKVGSLALMGPPSGAPVGVGFAAERCEAEGVTFVGEAARTSDPITFEGIDQAMRSAHRSALALHHAIRRRARPVGLGRQVARANLRVGQDSAMIARLGHELARTRRPHGGSADLVRIPTPVFSTARSMLIAEVDRPSITDTPAARTGALLGFAGILHELDERIRDEVRTEFFLSSELILRDVCAGVGPLGALTVFASQSACGLGDGDEAADAALCVEMLRIFPTMLGRVTAVSRDHDRANNAVAVMTADYALSRAITAAARLGTVHARMLADAIEATSEAGALVQGDRLQMTADAHRQWSVLGRGSSLSLAARMGAHLGRADAATVHRLGSAGEKIGVAVQICEDVLALSRQDPITGRQPWRALQEGGPLLPVMLAIEAEPRILSLLLQAKTREHYENALDVISRGEGFSRAEAMCRRQLERAKEIIDSAAGREAPLLHVCDVPIRCLSSFARARARQGPAVARGASRPVAS